MVNQLGRGFGAPASDRMFGAAPGPNDEGATRLIEDPKEMAARREAARQARLRDPRRLAEIEARVTKLQRDHALTLATYQRRLDEEYERALTTYGQRVSPKDATAGGLPLPINPF